MIQDSHRNSGAQRLSASRDNYRDPQTTHICFPCFLCNTFEVIQFFVVCCFCLTYSTSPSGGHQVDGLPPAPSYENVQKVRNSRQKQALLTVIDVLFGCPLPPGGIEQLN